jgi:hypothetical protein
MLYALVELKIFSSAFLTKLQVFKVTMQADTIGNRLKEVQDKAQNLATFGMFL